MFFLPLGLFIPFLLFLGFILLFIVLPAVLRQIRINSSPMLTRPARVLTKRTEVWGHKATRTSYYVTFELDGAVREEFETTGEQWGLLVEGDEGTLVTQGPALRSFDRAL